MVLSLFSTTLPLSYCPLFQAPLTLNKLHNQMHIRIGKLIDQTFHVVEHVRQCFESVLAPLISPIYINDITQSSSFHTTLFADDNNLHMSNSCFDVLQTTVNLE